eukprot:SAG11_NODE_1041_length_6056_cov_5.902468_2_plen_58_part_00
MDLRLPLYPSSVWVYVWINESVLRVSEHTAPRTYVLTRILPKSVSSFTVDVTQFTIL